jgi:hypothetical protein
MMRQDTLRNAICKDYLEFLMQDAVVCNAKIELAQWLKTTWLT